MMFLKDEEMRVLKGKFEDLGERIRTRHPSMNQLLVALSVLKARATKPILAVRATKRNLLDWSCNKKFGSNLNRSLWYDLRPAPESLKPGWGSSVGSWDVFDFPDRFKKAVVKAEQLGFVKVDSIADNWPIRFDMYDEIKITKKGEKVVEELRKKVSEGFKNFRKRYEKKNAKKIIRERILTKDW